VLVAAIDTPTIDWAALSPYLVLLGGTSVCMLAAVLVRPGARNGVAAAVSVLTLLGAGAAAIVLYTQDENARAIIGDALVRDRLADLTHVILVGAGLLTVFAWFRESDSSDRRADSYALILSAVAGMAFFVASNNLITLFLGLEWFSISLYILCAVTIERSSALESGLKYLIIGSFSSAVLLFGSALVFGATGEVGFVNIAQAGGDASEFLLVTGLAMLLVGLGFKASAAPFHQWTPDVYEGAPTPVTGFMASATKVAALVLTLRFLTTAFPEQAELWTIALGVLATASLVVGNLGALVQRNVKRILAYSSISQAGFLLMPIAAGNEAGGSALVYYLIPYVALSAGAFAVVAARERELGQPVTLDNLTGFGWERPLHGAAMAICMLGFIGLPPVGLFLGKFLAFASLFDRGWVWLMIIGAVFTAVSIPYYLGVVGAMYRRRTELSLAPSGGSPPRDRALDLAIAGSVVVGTGSFFGVDSLLDVIDRAVAILPFAF
jgi:NADH-quinone oxidoreductase subunit N